jgi:hypothetical protein
MLRFLFRHTITPFVYFRLCGIDTLYRTFLDSFSFWTYRIFPCDLFADSASFWAYRIFLCDLFADSTSFWAYRIFLCDHFADSTSFWAYRIFLCDLFADSAPFWAYRIFLCAGSALFWPHGILLWLYFLFFSFSYALFFTKMI